MKLRVLGHGTGWLPDYPDTRDYTIDRDEVSARLRGLGERDSVKRMLSRAMRGRGGKLPASVDLRPFCSPVEDQGSLGSCTAHAAASLVEYFERRSFGRHIDASRLFIYRTTRSLMHAEGDTGAFIRTAMGALVLFGSPPEEYWPYREGFCDREPPAFCYAFARSYRALSYYRLDPPGAASADVLTLVKKSLAAGLPAMFGFTVYSSIDSAQGTGKIPYPGPDDEAVGGHAVAAVGYDDRMTIPRPGSRGDVRGAVLVRNSWGEGWGERGYGWLPYDYVLAGLAEDFWSLIKNDWIDTGAFAA